jgi:plasmid stability protein
MSTLTIRNLDPAVKRRLRTRAAENDRSMEEEVREILREALGAPQIEPRPDLMTEIRSLVEKYGAADDLVLPSDEIAEPMSFE